MQKSKIPKKTTGWATAYCSNGQIHLIFVRAKDKIAAIKKFEKMEFRIVSEDQVRHVCMVTYPGPLEVQNLPDYDWESKALPIKNNNNGE